MVQVESEEERMATVGVEEQQLLIGGRWRGSSSGATYEKANPYSGAPAGRASAATREGGRAAVEAAAEAFPAWAATPVVERRAILDRAADLLMERQEEIASIVTDETGATVGWGMFNVELAAGMLHSAGAVAAELHDEEIASVIPGKKARAVRQPVGVVVGIAPWNAPVILGTRALASPLALGNTVVLKASEECPRTHATIVQALQDAGAPDGVVNLIVNDPADAPGVVDELISHPAVRRVNFTGSTPVGRMVAENAARHLKRVLLELGGKATLGVRADAAREQPVSAASFGSFF